MLKYIENTKLENVTNADIFKIHELVEKAKHRKEVGISYMKMWEEKRLIEKKALAQGREEVMGTLIETCQEFHATKEDTINRLKIKFGLSEEDAAEYMERYWKQEQIS